jgi:hypothetical protein
MSRFEGILHNNGKSHSSHSIFAHSHSALQYPFPFLVIGGSFLLQHNGHRFSQHSRKSDQGIAFSSLHLFLFCTPHVDINVDIAMSSSSIAGIGIAGSRLTIDTDTHRFHPHEGIHEPFRQPRVSVPIGERPVNAG